MITTMQTMILKFLQMMMMVMIMKLLLLLTVMMQPILAIK